MTTYTYTYTLRKEGERDILRELNQEAQDADWREGEQEQAEEEAWAEYWAALGPPVRRRKDSNR